jgi:hypothetical protein
LYALAFLGKVVSGNGSEFNLLLTNNKINCKELKGKPGLEVKITTARRMY